MPQSKKNKKIKSKKLKRIIKTYNSKIITDNTTYLSQTTYKPIYQYISVLQVKKKMYLRHSISGL